MGAEPSKPASMDDTIREMKLSAKKMEKDSGVCLAKSKENQRLALEAVKKGQKDVARIRAGTAMANEKRQLALLKMSAQMQAVADKLEDADRMKTLSTNLRSMTSNLSTQLQSMDLTEISSVLKQFGKEFEDLDLVSSRMDATLDGVMDDAAPTAAVDVYLNQLEKQAAADASVAGSNAAAIPGVGVGAAGQGVGQAPIASGPAFPGAPPPGAPGGGAPGAGGGGGGGGGGGDSLQARLDRLKNGGK